MLPEYPPSGQDYSPGFSIYLIFADNQACLFMRQPLVSLPLTPWWSTS